MAIKFSKEALIHYLERYKRQPTDVVGIDVGSSSIKMVRLRSSGSEITLVGAALLPPLGPPSTSANGIAALVPLEIPIRLRARHASLAFTASSAVVKLLSFPGSFDAKAEDRVVSSLGLDDPNLYRVSYRVVSEGHGRSESRVLTVAWPEEEAILGPGLLPIGLPAPFSLEISGIAALSTFLFKRDASFSRGAVGTLDFGATTTTYTLFNKGVLSLIRRFAFGTGTILQRVQNTLGVDRETAEGILADGSFDISQPVSEAMETLIKQLIVSRDFVERRENCQVSRLFVSGGVAHSHDALRELKSSMEIEVELWNPLEGIAIAKDAIPKELVGREWMLSAAVGASLATLEGA